MMQIARVVGHATATIKHASLNGFTLHVIQFLTHDDKPDGEPQIALDTLGAYVGARVIVVNDGSALRELTKTRSSPARWLVLGILDS